MYKCAEVRAAWLVTLVISSAVCRTSIAAGEAQSAAALHDIESKAPLASMVARAMSLSRTASCWVRKTG